jgi:undecaprenyl-diphosphatase
MTRALWHWLTRHPWSGAALLLAGAGALIFLHLAGALHEGALTGFDAAVGRAVRGHHDPRLLTLAVVLSRLLLWPDAVVLYAPFVLLLTARRRLWQAVITAAAPLATWGLVWLLKAVFLRPRPAGSLVFAAGHSFPSGHAAVGIVFYGLIGYICWRHLARTRFLRAAFALLAAALIVATGAARVYLDVHYPSDVLAGWAGGACMLFGTLVVLETLERRGC